MLDYPYFKKYCKLSAIDLSKQHNNFTGNLSRAEGVTMFFTIAEVKETVLDFLKGTVKVLWFYFVLI